MWDQAELGFEGVIAIAGELINEHAILERCPENIGGNNPCNGDKGPIRAHDKRPSRNIIRAPAYMGCRTNRYGPDDMTLWPRSV